MQVRSFALGRSSAGEVLQCRHAGLRLVARSQQKVCNAVLALLRGIVFVANVRAKGEADGKSRFAHASTAKDGELVLHAVRSKCAADRPNARSEELANRSSPLMNKR